jgi:hypothetical protein
MRCEDGAARCIFLWLLHDEDKGRKHGQPREPATRRCIHLQGIYRDPSFPSSLRHECSRRILRVELWGTRIRTNIRFSPALSSTCFLRRSESRVKDRRISGQGTLRHSRPSRLLSLPSLPPVYVLVSYLFSSRAYMTIDAQVHRDVGIRHSEGRGVRGRQILRCVRRTPQEPDPVLETPSSRTVSPDLHQRIGPASTVSTFIFPIFSSF